MHRHTTRLAAVFAAFAFAAAAGAASDKTSTNLSADGIAVKGYDVVAYFEEQRPIKGNPAIAYRYHEATYLFASTEHRDLFVKKPDGYVPQYGGYCAFGTSKGHKADIDPESWAVVDGKLYLNSSKGAQKLFDKDPKGSIEQADANWEHLK